MAQEETRILLEGYNDLKKILAKVDPDLRREMDREIRDILKPVALRAKEYVPRVALSGWRQSEGAVRFGAARMPAWNYQGIVRNIKVLQGGKRLKGSARSSVWRIRNQEPSGAVFELAGRGPSTHSFVKAIMKTHGRPARLIWRAWDEAGGDKVVTKKVVNTIDDYGRVFATELSNVTGK